MEKKGKKEKTMKRRERAEWEENRAMRERAGVGGNQGMRERAADGEKWELGRGQRREEIGEGGK